MTFDEWAVAHGLPPGADNGLLRQGFNIGYQIGVDETRKEMLLPCAACAERGEVVTRRMNSEPGECPHGYGFDTCTQCHEAFHAGRKAERERWAKRTRDFAEHERKVMEEWERELAGIPSPNVREENWFIASGAASALGALAFEMWGDEKEPASAEASTGPERGAP